MENQIKIKQHPNERKVIFRNSLLSMPEFFPRLNLLLRLVKMDYQHIIRVVVYVENFCKVLQND